MTRLEESMMYDRAFSEMANIIHYANSRRNEAEDKAKERNEPMPDFYDALIGELYAMRKMFREKSDEAWSAHKEEHKYLDDDGIANLANAVVISAIEDYEEATSSGRVGANGMRNAIRKFAKTEAGFYTTADVTAILTRIDAAYPKFKERAFSRLDSIKAETKRLGVRGDGRCKFGEPSNPNRCPLCGGGMWLYKGTQSDGKRVKCSGCNLSVKVDNI